MKALLASLATAAVITGAAWAGNVTPQQVSTLNARVTALSKSNGQLVAYVDKCLRSFVGVAEYGSSTGDGYVYDLADGSPTIKTSALDLTQAGDTSAYYFVYSKVDCAALTP